MEFYPYTAWGAVLAILRGGEEGGLKHGRGGQIAEEQTVSSLQQGEYNTLPCL